MIKKVYLVFKTHLDIGFTDYSENIVNSYLDSYIPSAIKLGYELKDTGTPFVWTCGSWLIYKALLSDRTGNVEKAIRDGIISWHGLPFSTHTELMNTTLFECGLSLSKQLDEKFGKKTIGAKMTDVPGHTVGMVPLMEKAGIRFLHIGVNPATPVPPVPPLFRWKCGQSSIVVMYQGDYGNNAEFSDFAVCFGHTGDNKGPQSADEIKKLYAELSEKYPGAEICAATLDDIAERICEYADVCGIPVVDKEIGDTWIHGAGTDPLKLSRYRALLRYIEKNKDKIAPEKLFDNLLMIPEHTWGMDVKTFFHDDKNYLPEDFEKTFGTSDRLKIETSWREQRAYAEKAERVLGLPTNTRIEKPDLSGYEKCDDKNVGIRLYWQLFDKSDYERYENTYMRCHLDWAIWDFTKVGLPDYTGGVYQAEVTDSYKKGDKYIYRLRFRKELAEKYGLPEFFAEKCGTKLEIKQFGKKASRLPQAYLLKFEDFNDDKLEIRKMGIWIKPENIIGSPLVTATDFGVRSEKKIIESLDAALCLPYGKKLLCYGKRDDEAKDFYFCLYNNIWNTNFPMWDSSDTKFTFRINDRLS